jgi:MoxR-like ATPase
VVPGSAHAWPKDSSGNGAAGLVEWFAEHYEVLARNVETFIRGKPEVVRAALVCMFAEGHLLIEDVPGVGKTSLAQSLAAASGRPFVTAQDVKTVAPNVLCHRMILRPEVQLQGHIAEALLDSILSAVPVPQERSRV